MTGINASKQRYVRDVGTGPLNAGRQQHGGSRRHGSANH